MYINISIRLPLATKEAIKKAALQQEKRIPLLMGEVIFGRVNDYIATKNFLNCYVESGIPHSPFSFSLDATVHAVKYITTIDSLVQKSNTTRSKLISSILVQHFSPWLCVPGGKIVDEGTQNPATVGD